LSATDDLLRSAQAYAAAFDKADLPIPPARKVAIVACMRKLLTILNAMVKKQQPWCPQHL